MSGTQVIRSAPSHADESAHGLAPFIKGLWAAYWQSRARRASVVYLNSLDNRTLDDIGLDRSEIDSFVYAKSAHERRRRYDPSWQ